MKKLLKGLLLVVAAVALSLCFVACNSNGNDKENNNGGSNTELRIETVYAAAVDLGFDGTLDDLIAAFKGDSAYTIAVSKGYTGSEADWLASLVGASGKDGANGITPHIGGNGNWFIGTTDTGVKAKGEDGADGEDGKSAYQIWLDNGHSGTEADFLEWLKGQNGANGEDGKSAYQIWLDNGHSGTEADFLEWLKGQNGANGEDGANGLSTYEIFVKHNPDYLGDEAQWIDDYINGRLVRFTVTFKAAGSEDIVKSVFYGYDLTDIPAVPEKVGNTGEWDRTDFTNITENITVTAIYKTIGLIFTLINNETEYKLTSANLDSDVNVLVIPAEYEGKPVTSIGYQAFMNQTNLTNVTIPNSVTLIEQSAFYGCTAIQAITIPFTGESATSTTNTHFGYIFGASSGSGQNNSIPSSLKTVVITNCKSIGDYAFSGCNSLTSIIIPDSVTSIGDYAFSGCNSLTSVTLPDSVTSIGESAFSNSYHLTSITIGGGVNTIGSRAFENCNSLTSITIPDSVNSIGRGAFENCNNLQFEIYNGNLKYLGNVLIGVTSTAIKTVSLKPTTTVIYNKAFSDCSGLTSITIGGGVPSIGDYAFSGCSSLTSITIGGSVTSIGISAFSGCSGLESITLPFVGNSKDGTTNIHFGYIFGASSVYDQNNSIPSSLKTVVITNCKSIGDYAFYDCNSLTSIIIPDSVTSIGESAFSGCSSLTSITIGGGVTSIGVYAFSGCSSLTTVTIPDSVTSIGISAFSDCSGLESITLPFVGNSKDGTTNIHFGYIFGASSSSGQNNRIPSSLKTVVITNCKSIGDYAFSDCSSLTSIIIPDGVTSIGSSAFYGCSSLTSVIIPDGVTSIGISAFSGCSGLTSITIGGGVTSIGISAFSGCTNLTNVYYKGTAEQWNSISIDVGGNQNLTSATRYYYSETQPESSGNYWHYDKNNEIAIW